MDTIKLSQGEIKITDNVFINPNVKKTITDSLFGYYTKPHGKKQILVNFKNPGEFFSMKKKYYYATSCESETIKLYKDLIQNYPELDSVELKMWFINIEISQNKSYSIASIFEKMMQNFGLKKISYKFIVPSYMSRSISTYIDFTGITEDELIKFIENLLTEQCSLDYYFGNNYEELIEKTIKNKLMEFVEMLINKNSTLSEIFLKKFKPKFGLKFITTLFDKKEYNRIQYYLYKESLTPSQRDEFLPKMIPQIYSFNHEVTYDDYLQLFEGKIEITKFPYKKWIQNSKDKVEMFMKMDKYMDIQTRKEIMVSMIQNCYSKESLNELLKVFIY
jgi:hypothetical protein